MSSRDYIASKLDILPESTLEKVQEFISFQLYCLGMFEDDTEYLESIPGMAESIMEGKAAPVSECLDSVGWDIN